MKIFFKINMVAFLCVILGMNASLVYAMDSEERPDRISSLSLARSMEESKASSSDFPRRLTRVKVLDLDPERRIDLLGELNMSGLVELDLTAISSKAFLPVLSRKLSECDSLQVLNLSKTSLDDDGCALLREILRDKRTLRVLNLADNEIGVRGIESLEDILRNTPLQTLDLSYNKGIGDEGAQCLARALLGNKSLETLNLSGIKMGSRGAQTLMPSLKGSILKILYLGDNKIGVQGARAIATWLEGNTTLNTLDLCGNESIKETGVAALAQALTVNKTLGKLDLLFCAFEGKDIREIFAGVLETRGAPLHIEPWA